MTDPATISKGSDWGYAPAPESTDHIRLKDRYGLFIGGQFVPPVSGKYFKTINPANEKVLSEIADAGEKDIDRAVKAARQLIGATNPVEAATGSIRGDFGTEVTFNLVHGSDSDESAEREIAIWFPELG